MLLAREYLLQSVKMDDFKPNLDVLIPMVKQVPAIWDKDAQGYKNKDVTDRVWDDIGRTMNVDYDKLPVDKARKKIKDKWTNARDIYQRKFKKHMELLQENLGKEEDLLNVCINSLTHIPGTRPDLNFLLKVYLKKPFKYNDFQNGIGPTPVKRCKFDVDSEAETEVNEKLFPNFSSSAKIAGHILKHNTVTITSCIKPNTSEINDRNHNEQELRKQEEEKESILTDSEIQSIPNEDNELGEVEHIISDSDSETEDKHDTIRSDSPEQFDQHLLQTSEKLKHFSPTYSHLNEGDDEEYPSSNQSYHPPKERLTGNPKKEDDASSHVDHQPRNRPLQGDVNDNKFDSFFNLLVPHIKGFDDFQMLTFQTEVLNVVRSIKFPKT